MCVGEVLGLAPCVTEAVGLGLREGGAAGWLRRGAQGPQELSPRYTGTGCRAGGESGAAAPPPVAGAGAQGMAYTVHRALSLTAR